jgi:hypothetical protein
MATVAGAGGVGREVTAAWDRVRGFEEWREPIGGWPWGGVKEKRRRGFWQRRRPRAPLLPRVQEGNDKQRILPRFPRLQRGRQCRSSSSPWGFVKKKRKQRNVLEARVVMADFKFKF